ncbi:VanZ family protein [Bacillus sp. FJAT-49731]|nr:VanZ family protein [Lederbergia citrea]MBS4178168.1 VanZ family protein [Lederbergia citrea]
MLLIVATIIFAFSSQTYEQQSLVPTLWKIIPGEPFREILSKLEIKYWGQIISVETKGYYYFLEFLIRKFAHMFLFGCLAVTLFSVIMLAKPKRIWPVVWVSLIATGFYASFDELHQLYTGGRTPLVADVLLDLSGAVVALIIFVPYHILRRKSGR